MPGKTKRKATPLTTRQYQAKLRKHLNKFIPEPDALQAFEWLELARIFAWVARHGIAEEAGISGLEAQRGAQRATIDLAIHLMESVVGQIRDQKVPVTATLPPGPTAWSPSSAG